MDTTRDMMIVGNAVTPEEECGAFMHRVAFYKGNALRPLRNRPFITKGLADSRKMNSRAIKEWLAVYFLGFPPFLTKITKKYS